MSAGEWSSRPGVAKIVRRDRQDGGASKARCRRERHAVQSCVDVRKRTAERHRGVDFPGKRVGLVGTGSTGIQATPVIARQAEHLYVFQRTPNYSIPARNHPLTAEELDEIKANYAEIRRKCRESYAGF